MASSLRALALPAPQPQTHLTAADVSPEFSKTKLVANTPLNTAVSISRSFSGESKVAMPADNRDVRSMNGAATQSEEFHHSQRVSISQWTGLQLPPANQEAVPFSLFAAQTQHGSEGSQPSHIFSDLDFAAAVASRAAGVEADAASLHAEMLAHICDLTKRNNELTLRNAQLEAMLTQQTYHQPMNGTPGQQ